ncbi:MAG: IS5 family transposase [Candidatus Kaistia colombiensis]|nr:MAG: IS5 family transposase [Kaistia sp.]
MVWTKTTRQQHERMVGRYASDLTDAEWALIAPFLPAASVLGRPRTTSMRAVMNALLYVLSTGCQWRSVPHDFPPRPPLQRYFYRWRDQGIWGRMNAHLVAMARQAQGRSMVPSVGIIDSQSVPTTQSGDPSGLDPAKRIKGRKRHIVTDVEGFVLMGQVHRADIQDSHGAVSLLQALAAECPLRHILADRVYRGPKLLGAVADCGPWIIEIVQRPAGTKGFQLLPRRWVVERTFAWLGRNRRLAKDYEATIASAHAWLMIACIKLLVRRLDQARN